MSGLFLALFVGICAFAWWKGRPAERYGALLYFLSVTATMGFEAITGQATPTVPELFCDLIVAVGFLALAIRYNSPWLGAAMVVKGLQLAVHSTHLTDGAAPTLGGVDLYAAALVLISFVILGIILAGTLAGLRERKRRSQRPETPQAPAQRAHRPDKSPLATGLR